MSPPVRRVLSDEKLPAEADVVVIGGGIAGVAAAWELGRRGKRVALLEKGVIAGEQSSRNWGWCRQINRDEREIPLSILALRMWPELTEAVGADLGFRRTGLIYTTTTQADLDRWSAWSEMAKGYGVEARMLSGREASAMLPGNSGNWIGGVYSPIDGRAEPELATSEIAAAARRHGVTIHQGCAAREIDMTAGHVSGVATEKGLIRCPAVLVAGGAWTGMLLRHHRLKFLQASVQATACYTAAAPDVTKGGVSLPGVALRRRLDDGYTLGLGGKGTLNLSPWGILQAGPFWKSFLERRKGLSYALNRSFFDGPESLHRWSADTVSPFERNRIADPPANQLLINRGLEKLTAAYPALAGTEVAARWGALMDFTPDAIPVISAVKSRPGLFISSGYSGHGFGVGPAAGRLAADLISGDTPCVDPSPFRYERMIDGTKLDGPGMF